ncbi:MAG: hypothetical protein ABIH28_01590 [archaeon]
MNKWLEILIGLILINVSIYLFTSSYQWGAFWNFRSAAWILIKGCFFWGIVFAGILFVILGLSDLKN